MIRYRVIRAPETEVKAMLMRKISAESRQMLEQMPYDTVALVQTDIPSIYYFADLAAKASSVYTTELMGSCPQHISALAVFGGASAVEEAVQAILHEE